MRRALTLLDIATGVKAGKVPRRYSESVEQRLFVQRWRLHPKTKGLPACAIPNAGRRGKAQGGLMQAEGMSRGAPDWLCFAHGIERVELGFREGDGYMPDEYGVVEWQDRVGLALEFKRPDGKGKVSPEQAQWHQQLRGLAWRVEVVTSAEAAWAVVTDYLRIGR